MKKSHRIALAPTPEQERAFGQHAGYARLAYNWAVAEIKAGLDVGEWLSDKTLRPRWNKVKLILHPWATELSQNAAKYAVIDAGDALEKWGAYRRRVKAGQNGGRRVGFPRFKKRRHEQGFRVDNGPDTIRVAGKTVKLSKIGAVAMVEELRFTGSIREVTINRTAGRWFASFSMETGEAFPPVKDGPVIGIDMGLATLATCSDGTVIENPRALRSVLKRLRRVDKAIARSKNVHGRNNHSNRRDRLYCHRRAIHARASSMRNDVHHKATSAIAKSAGQVNVETLNIVGMMQNRSLARAFADAGVGNFLRMLEYKCQWYGAALVKADRWFPSSKLCGHCGVKNAGLKLSERSWWCGSCGALNDRDFNAAVNLANHTSASSSFSPGEKAHGEAVSPATRRHASVKCEEVDVHDADPRLAQVR